MLTFLVIDDHTAGRVLLTELLESNNHTVFQASSPEEAVDQHSTLGDVKFILLDRNMPSGVVEASSLSLLKSFWPKAHIIVYTNLNDLTEKELYAIKSAGAIRVLDKSHLGNLADDVQKFIDHCGQLLELGEYVRAAIEERSQMASALLGTRVGVAIVDQEYRCWFMNSILKDWVGGSNANDLYWRQFFGLPLTVGPRWGCTVTAALTKATECERLRYLPYVSGTVHWHRVRVTPIFDASGKKVIAVTKGVVRLARDYVYRYTISERLWRIAQSLLFLGFGRVRIHRIDYAAGVIMPIAAAAISDGVEAPSSDYFNSVARLRPPYKDCPYVREVMSKGTPLLVERWNKGPSHLAHVFNLEPPYILCSIFSQDSAVGLLALDFSNESQNIDSSLKDHLCSPAFLQILEEGYLPEIKRTVWGEGTATLGQPPKLDVLHRARLELATIESITKASEVLLRAINDIVPDCRANVRLLSDGTLTRSSVLSKEPIESTPSTIAITDSISISAFCARTTRILDIDDYPLYRKEAEAKRMPPGYVPSTYKSVVSIPLMVESKVVGTLGVDSLQHLEWTNEGYLEPLRGIADLLALFIRDKALTEKAAAELHDVNLALTAYTLTTSNDAIWRHWAKNRLSEAKNLLSLIQDAIYQLGHYKLVAKDLLRLSDDLEILQKQQPVEGVLNVCECDKALDAIRIRYFDQPVKIEARVIKLNIQEFRLQHILEVLINNALRSMRATSMGTVVAVAVKSEGNKAIITVRDDGPGIPLEIQQDLFKGPIKGNRINSGSGIGLLIARGAALACGGDLKFTSVPGDTIFTLTVPKTSENNAL